MISVLFSNMAAMLQRVAVALLFLFSGVSSFPLGQETKQTRTCGYEVSCDYISAVYWCVLVV